MNAGRTAALGAGLMGLVAGLTGAMVVSACGAKSVHTKPPTVEATPRPTPALSVISLPVTIPLETMREAAEAALEPIEDSKYTQCDGKLGEGGWCAKASFTPGAVEVSAEGKEIRVRFELKYGLAFKIKKKGKPLVKCTGRIATITLATTWDVRPDWTPVLETETRVKPKNKCDVKVLAFEADATGVILKFMREGLRKAANAVEKAANGSLALKEGMEKAWADLQAPVAVKGGGWLSVAPRELGMGPVETTAEAITLHFSLTAAPLFRLGSPPTVASDPLPDLAAATTSDRFRITLPIELGYGALQEQIDAMLAKSGGTLRYPPEGEGDAKRYIEFNSVRVEGFGTKVLVTMAFTGNKRLTGTAYLRGTPAYDVGRNVLTFPDLDFSADTNKALYDAFLWLNRKKIRDTLREKLVVDLSETLEKTRTGINESLNGSHRGVELTGVTEELRLLGLWADPEAKALVTVVHLEGRLRVVLRDLSAAASRAISGPASGPASRPAL